jgi:hypothetical protein
MDGQMQQNADDFQPRVPVYCTLYLFHTVLWFGLRQKRIKNEEDINLLLRFVREKWRRQQKMSFSITH